MNNWYINFMYIMPKEKPQLPNPWIIYLITSVGIGIIAIGSGTINIALPAIADQFQTKILEIQWVIVSYLLTLCTLLPLSGYLSDIYTKRLICLLGFSVFTISSLLCGLSFSLNSLIIFRFLQGIGASMIIASNQAIIMTNLPGSICGKALGINSMVVALGTIIGFGIGGILVNHIGWRSIFFINIPFGLFGYYLGCKFLPRDFKKSIYRFDFLGTILFAITMTSFIFTLINGAKSGWSSILTIFLTFTFFVALSAFLVREKLTKSPIVDLILFKNTAFSSGNIIFLLVLVALHTNLIILPFYLNKHLHLSFGTVGFLLLIIPTFTVIFSPIGGNLINSFGQHSLITIGLTAMLLGLLGLSLSTKTLHIWEIILYLSLIGTGYGFLNAPNNYNMLNNIPKEKLGSATGIIALTRNVGRICGAIIAASVFTTSQYQPITSITNIEINTINFTSNFKITFIIAALFVFAATILSFISKILYLRQSKL